MANAEPTATPTPCSFERIEDRAALVRGDDPARRPVIGIASEATPQELAAIMRSRVELLHKWVEFVYTGNQDFDREPAEVAGMLAPMVEDALMLARALDDRLRPPGRLPATSAH